MAVDSGITLSSNLNVIVNTNQVSMDLSHVLYTIRRVHMMVYSWHSLWVLGRCLQLTMTELLASIQLR